MVQRNADSGYRAAAVHTQPYITPKKVHAPATTAQNGGVDARGM
jgi:hypothetical protein